MLLPPVLLTSSAALFFTAVVPRRLAEIALPSPNDFRAIGWWLAVALVVLKGGDFVLDFYKKHIKTDGGVFATAKELERLRVEVDQQIKESRSYVHDEVHRLSQDLARYSTDSHNGRESVQNRLNVQVELLHHLRGQMDGVLIAAKTVAEAAERAAERADKAAERVGFNKG